jgi:cytochrome c peroxidase
MISKYILLIGAGIACTKAIVHSFDGFQKPANFPEPVYHFQTNEITAAKFELGRKLFYEPRFSRDNTVSCGTCHIQSAGFTHHGHDVSHGIDDRLGNRNSPSIANMAWNKTFFWDGGVFDLDLQPIVPITNPVEMDETVSNVIRKLNAHPDYPGLFKKAFGTEEISTARMMKALSQFMVMLVSANSKYDSVMRGENVVFTVQEKQGYALFRAHCAGCHKEPLFTDDSFRDNGIGAGPNNDQGRFVITLNDKDKYTFKVPGLRNISYTAPYMHDGRFRTIEAVLEHYTKHIKATPNLDPLLKPGGLPLTVQEQSNIIAFLKTLDDRTFITDKRFSEQ